MTPVETVFHYGRALREAEMRALHEVREVYGIRQLAANQKTNSIRVEYDASRLSENDVAALLREAGIELREPVKSAAP
jgi:hypothetical protein